MESTLPFSQACENNKQPILDVLQPLLAGKTSVLEIGGGTGQHAVFFARHLPQVRWITSELPSHTDTLNIRLSQAGLANLSSAIAIDVTAKNWGVAMTDAVFTANTLHIMSAHSVELFFAGVARIMSAGGLLISYGPFKYAGKFTSDSNARFDLWLKQRNPESGVRDFEWVNDLARANGMILLEDNAMPANNQMLVWRMQNALAR